MLKRMQIACASAIAVTLLAGCAPLASLTSLLPGRGAAAPEPLTTTTVQLSQNNYTVQKWNIVGTSTGFRLLGFITIVPATRVKALTQMYKIAALDVGHATAPANILIEDSDSYFILFSIPRVRSRADFVEFETGQTQTNPAQPSVSPGRS